MQMVQITQMKSQWSHLEKEGKLRQVHWERDAGVVAELFSAVIPPITGKGRMWDLSDFDHDC